MEANRAFKLAHKTFIQKVWNGYSFFELKHNPDVSTLGFRSPTWHTTSTPSIDSIIHINPVHGSIVVSGYTVNSPYFVVALYSRVRC